MIESQVKTPSQKRTHRNYAVMFWFISWLLAVLGGILFSGYENISWDQGIYWALTTVTTVGYGDITPHNLVGYVIADCTMVLTIPIWSVAVAFATSWLTSWHIWDSHDQMKTHVETESTSAKIDEADMNRILQAIGRKR